MHFIRNLLLLVVVMCYFIHSSVAQRFTMAVGSGTDTITAAGFVQTNDVQLKIQSKDRTKASFASISNDITALWISSIKPRASGNKYGLKSVNLTAYLSTISINNILVTIKFSALDVYVITETEFWDVTVKKGLLTTGADQPEETVSISVLAGAGEVIAKIATPTGSGFDRNEQDVRRQGIAFSVLLTNDYFTNFDRTTVMDNFRCIVEPSGASAGNCISYIFADDRKFSFSDPPTVLRITANSAEDKFKFNLQYSTATKVTIQFCLSAARSVVTLAMSKTPNPYTTEKCTKVMTVTSSLESVYRVINMNNAADVSFGPLKFTENCIRGVNIKTECPKGEAPSIQFYASTFSAS
eukprot:PhF_6_TR44173/c0_g1_i3/m.67675